MAGVELDVLKRFGLSAAISARMAMRPFIWGESDCCLAVCDVLTDIGLPDPASLWRGRYSDEAEAARIIKQGGGLAAVADAAFSKLDWPKIAVADARLGDVGIVCAPDETLAVFNGDYWFAKSPRGVARVESALCAWATGFVECPL